MQGLHKSLSCTAFSFCVILKYACSGVADQHGCAAFHNLESVLLIKGDVFPFLRHQFYVKIVLVVFLDAPQQFGGNALPLIVGMHQQIMQVRQHTAVIQPPDQPHQVTDTP